MKSPTLIPILAFISFIASAQANRTHELGLVVDNDYPYMTDQYYTAGQDLYYRFLSKSKANQSRRSILSLHYGNKIFTPKNVDTDDPQLMDRPYCGWNFISAELRTLPRPNVSNLFALQVGMVGSESGMGQLQQWLHQAINLYGIEGWGYQISNETVVNANFNHTRSFTITEYAELISSGSIWAGTGNNRLSEELTLRLFRFNAITASSFLNANIADHSIARKHELYLFATLGGDYIFSNIFLEGSLFKSNPSPRTTSINPWLFSQKLGMQYAGSKFSLGISIVHVGRENNLVTSENYASGNVAYRF
ncbi:MAG TPA: lipid A-modifier LpxR family protein [Cyclobacteriaceae bacterium]|nr:lipid A-modifier LpxR family protein [Cyclobacteriaceae bacterium]